MKLDIKKALLSPFNIENKKEAIKIYLLGAVFSFLGYFNFSFRNSQNFSNDGHFKEAQHELSNQIHSLMSQSWFWPVIALLAVIVLIILIVRIFCMSVNLGYILETVKNEFLSKESIMPSWDNNIIKFSKKGFIYLTIKFIYGIAFLVIPIIIIAVSIYNLSRNFGQIDSPEMFVSQLLSPLFILGIGLLLFLSLILGVILPAVTINFARNETFTSGFNFPVIISTIANNALDYIIAILIQIPIIIGLIILNIGLCCTCIGILLIPFANYFIYQIIAMNLFAQAIKE